ncbi:MAG: TPM domain-containing protein [Flavobacteriales bacterium]
MNTLQAKQILAGSVKDRVENAIRKAETSTSAEIRMFAENRCKEDVLDHAAFVFGELKMHETKDRNGILIYIAFTDKKLAVIGDRGINMHVEPIFWNKLVLQCLESFKQGDYAGGLETLILSIGNTVKIFFPRQINDVNELSDAIDFGGEKA